MDIQEEKDAYLSELLAREAISQDEFDNIIFRPSVNAFDSNYLSARFIDNINWGWNSWQAAKAQAVPGWILVDDEPPTSNKTFSDAVIAWDGLCIRRIPLCLFKSTSEVTHWMPIPQPPKAQEPAND